MNAAKRISTASTLVISYLRFSRPEQLQGDSLRRQLEASERWAAARGLRIDQTLSDKGLSAYRGANAETGALSTFLALVRAGRIPAGSILLVESLDRLSRQKPRKAFRQFLDII